MEGVGNFRLDGNTVYWSEFQGGRIMALDL
jgi:hypothetical protein